MKLVNVKISELTFGHILRLIREIAIIGVASYLAIRVFSGDLSIDFTKLTPSELVSILLAFFSISLSAAFYFAATNASNQFYDNINKFNKDTSELLGRLDEQIKHVNSGQKELGERIDKRYLENNNGDDEPGNNSKENQEQIDAVQLKWQESLDKILNAATIEPEEKLKLEQQLKTKESELNSLREQQIKIDTKRMVRLKSYLSRRIESMGLEDAATYSPDELLYLLNKKSVPPVRRDLYENGYIEAERINTPLEVTEKGQDFISSIVSSMLKCES
jgi:hypothetical protein